MSTPGEPDTYFPVDEGDEEYGADLGYAELVDDDPDDVSCGDQGNDAALAELQRHAGAQARLLMLPAAVATVSGGIDLWQHSAMETAGHVHNVAGVMMHWGIGTTCTMALVTLATWVLSGRDALNHLPGQGRTVGTGDAKEPAPTVKPLILGGGIAGALVTLLGGMPLTATACTVLFLAATARWHWQRIRLWREARRQLRDARADAENAPALPAAPAPLALTAPPVDAAPIDQELFDIVARWDTAVTKVVKDTTLIRPQRHDPNRMSFIIDAGDGGVTLDQLAVARKQIAAALHLELPDIDGGGGQDVTFDQPPGLGLHQGQIRMQIIRGRSAVEAKSFRVPEIAEHQPGNPYAPQIGVYLDDHSPAWWTFADAAGAKSGLIIATSRYGKTYLKEQLSFRARQLGIHSIYIDPTEASSPVIANNATWTFRGLDECYAGYELINELSLIRQKWMRYHELGAITPSTIAPCRLDGERPDPDCPCGGIVPPPLAVFIEECDQVFNAIVPGTSTTKMGDRYGVVAKRVQKLMMAIIADSQIPGQEVFAGSEMLRSNITGNYYAGHVTSTASSNLIPGLPYAPVHIPPIPGRGLLRGPGSRSMDLVLQWAPRRTQDLPQVGPTGGPFIEDLFAVTPAPPMYEPDRLAATRFVPAVDSVEQADQQRELTRRQFVAAMNGRPTLELSTNAKPKTAPDATVDAAAPVEDVPDSLTTSLPEWPTPAPPMKAENVILELLRADADRDVPSRKGDLMERSGYSETMVRNVLNSLVKRGIVEQPIDDKTGKPRLGFYRIVEQVVAA